MNELREQLLLKAKTLGFARMHVLRAESVEEKWKKNGVSGRTVNSFMQTDPRTLMPGAKSILLFVWPFAPYLETPGEAHVSAYYVHSNAAYHAMGELKDWLEQCGFRALAHVNMPYKPLMECANAGRYGRNGVIAVPDYGSFIAIQGMLTDAELPTDEVGAEYTLSPSCEHCDICVRACPVAALQGDSTVDVSRCLRAQPIDKPIQPSYRPYMTTIVGCDICQTSCPRNAEVEPVEMPEELRNAMALPSLLAGNCEPLLPWVGSNCARKTRLQARACLIAGNNNRHDCIPMLKELSAHSDDAVREHALWALEKG